MTPEEIHAAKRLDAETLIREHAPARLQEQLIALLRLYIVVSATRTDDAQIPLGASKFGGAPDVPADFVWPMWNDKPLGFLAQINLEQMRGSDVVAPLPTQGLLSFFLSLDQENPIWGEPQQRGGWQVFYFSAQELRRTGARTHIEVVAPIASPHPQPQQKPKALRPHSQQLSFAWDWSLADDSVWGLDWAQAEWNNFEEGMEFWSHRMFGCPYAPQLSPFVIAENAAQGRNGDALYEDRVNTREWELLLQLNTASQEFFEGRDDLGWLYFLIRRDDLRNGDFARVWFNEQCT